MIKNKKSENKKSRLSLCISVVSVIISILSLLYTLYSNDKILKVDYSSNVPLIMKNLVSDSDGKFDVIDIKVLIENPVNTNILYSNLVAYVDHKGEFIPDRSNIKGDGYIESIITKQNTRNFPIKTRFDYHTNKLEEYVNRFRLLNRKALEKYEIRSLAAPYNNNDNFIIPNGTYGTIQGNSALQYHFLLLVRSRVYNHMSGSDKFIIQAKTNGNVVYRNKVYLVKDYLFNNSIKMVVKKSDIQ